MQIASRNPQQQLRQVESQPADRAVSCLNSRKTGGELFEISRCFERRSNERSRGRDVASARFNPKFTTRSVR